MPVGAEAEALCGADYGERAPTDQPPQWLPRAAGTRGWTRPCWRFRSLVRALTTRLSAQARAPGREGYRASGRRGMRGLHVGSVAIDAARSSEDGVGRRELRFDASLTFRCSYGLDRS
jgi:hypothetical protein